MKTKKILALLLAAVMLCSFAAACSSDEGEETGGVKDTVVVAINGEPTKLTPYLDTSANNTIVEIQMLEPLFRMDNEGNVHPLLAESYEYEDETTLVVKLREGVKFHNGDPLTADEVLFTYRKYAEQPAGSTNLAMIDTANSFARDEHTVVFKLNYSYGPLIRLMSTTATCIVSSRAIEELGEDGFSRAPVGTGPYKMGTWESGSSITLVRNDEYWGTPAVTPNLEFRIIVEATNRCIELETGSIDIAMDIQANDMDRISENPDLTLVQTPGVGVTIGRINTLKEPLTDPRVRLALIKALDVDAAVEAVYGGKGKRAWNGTASTIWGYDDTYSKENYAYDVEAAKQLMIDAGYPNGFDLTILTSDDTSRALFAEIMQNQWNELGINTKVQVYEVGTFFEYFRSADYQICMVSLNNDMQDPDNSLMTMFHTGMSEAPVYSNSEVDELLIQGRQETDETKRLEIYKEVQRILQEDVAVLPLAELDVISATRANVTGFEPMANTTTRFATVGFADAATGTETAE